MDQLVLPPALIMVLGAFAVPLFRGHSRTAYMLALPVLTLWAVWQVPDGSAGILRYLDFDLQPVRGTTLGRLFATVFALMAFTGLIFGLFQARTRELVAALVYSGSAIGVTLAGDFITVFIFWELMAVGSTVVIWSAGTQMAWGSGMRYLILHLFGGVILLVGIVGHINATGSIDFVLLEVDGWAHALILAGFLFNAGAPPFSAWIADAYPEASPSGTVFLSAFTTKTAVFVLLVCFAGFKLLIFIGLYMVFYGIIYALLENDMRRILAYSIINQVGFMITGIGIGTEMSLNGTAAHAFTHIIYKALLLMSAGSVLFMTGKRKCTDLGGLFQSMPITTWCGIIGALAISSFPFTSGFISKSMISQGAIDEGLALVVFLLAAASAGVFLHAGIKFPWFVFFQKDSGLRPPDPPRGMQVAMIFFASLCIGLGVYPAALYTLLPYPVTYVPYTAEHVVTQLQLLLFAGLAFFIMLTQLKRTLTISLDFDWFYRRFGKELAREFTIRGSHLHKHMVAHSLQRMDHFLNGLARTHGPQGIFARTWTTGEVVALAIALLGLVLAIEYVI